MGALNVRTDEAMEKALNILTSEGRSRSEAVRYALLRTYKELLLEQATADAERLENDPDDRAEMLAIQRFMGGQALTAKVLPSAAGSAMGSMA